MVSPVGPELDSLHLVADAIRDEVDENASRVEQAIDQHPAFSESDHVASSMIRQLALYGARSHGSDSGLVPNPVLGGLDLVWSADNIYRRYRIKKATRDDSTGGFRMLVSGNSKLVDPNADALPYFEQWVLGYTVTNLHTIGVVFASEVLGVTASTVGRLRLGPEILLGRAAQVENDQFVSDTEEMLPGFEDDPADFGSDTGTSA